MHDLIIKTKFNTIHISVEQMEDIEEVLSMPYVLSYEQHEVVKPKYKMLVKEKEKKVTGGKWRKKE